MGFLQRMHGRTQQNFCGILARRVQTESNHEETPANPADGILQTNWPVLFKDVSVMKEKTHKLSDQKGLKRQDSNALNYLGFSLAFDIIGTI